MTKIFPIYTDLNLDFMENVFNGKISCFNKYNKLHNLGSKLLFILWIFRFKLFTIRLEIKNK